MELTTNSLDIVFRNARLAFQGALDQQTLWSPELAVTIPSSTRREEYNWLDRVPQMRKWLGPRVIAQVAAHSRQLLNEPYEQTIELDKYDVEDDKVSLFYQGIAMQGAAAGKWPDTTVAAFISWAASSQLPDGTPNLGFDGVPLYSTAHPVLGGVEGAAYSVTGSTTQSNLLLNTPLTYDNYIAARVRMQNLVGLDGLPLGVDPNLLVVTPALAPMAKLIVEAEYVPSTAGLLAGGVTAGASPMTNTWRNSAKVLVLPQLANKPQNWWLHDTRQMKPYMFQLRTAPQFTQLTAPTSENVFKLHKFLYGVEARGAAAETLWWLSLAATANANSY